jgi:hypothetical protein
VSSWAAARAEVALEALQVPAETTIAVLCPVCHGGASGEKKLSVTRTHNGALYVCFRAACSFRGFVAIGEQGSKDMPRRPAPPRPFNGATEWDKDKAFKFWRTYEGLKDAVADDIRSWGVRWTNEAIVYECRGFRGELLGHVTRTPGKVVKTYRAKEGTEMYAVYDPDGSKSLDMLVLVEDCVSAMAVAANGGRAVALLGTNVPRAVDEVIRENAYPYVVVWLDPDAEAKSLAIASRYRGAKAVIGYPRDPKDLPSLGEILQMYR